MGLICIPTNMIVAGHQPNFFPWFGFFEKIIKSHIFVFSDDVQYPKQSYTNRTLIPIQTIESYVTLPVKQKGYEDQISKKVYLKDKKIIKKIYSNFYFNLCKLNYFSDIEDILEEFKIDYWNLSTISELNIKTILNICEKLNLNNTNFKKGTELNLDKYNKNDRLIERCRKLDCYNYLCGQGADGYQDEEYLRKNKINLIKIDYDIGNKIFHGDIKYSILYVISKYGLEKIKQAIVKYNENIVH
ncbi:MAG: hypothetical protein CMM02_05510 [Rhodopirellula sp.]|nr:hypothetical protein [Rhodopirellula sp.]|tara:strand:+ start:9510 stop:10241 length:732 start_codon:yes stop_codon:yes gene_type:complete